MKKTILLVTGLCLMAAPVLAGQFGHLDANGDSKITLQEMQSQAEKHFQTLDANHDGQISSAEREQHLAARATRKGSQNGQVRHPRRQQTQRQGVDADKNGLISRTESLAGVQKRFARLDANRDGIISQDELAQRRQNRRQGRKQGPNQQAL